MAIGEIRIFVQTPPLDISTPNLQEYPVGQITGFLPPHKIGEFGIGVSCGHRFEIMIWQGGLLLRQAGLGVQVGDVFGMGVHHPASGWAIMHGGLSVRQEGIGWQWSMLLWVPGGVVGKIVTARRVIIDAILLFIEIILSCFMLFLFLTKCLLLL